jgi:DNA-binding beta-propeller fold protein YncE
MRLQLLIGSSLVVAVAWFGAVTAQVEFACQTVAPPQKNLTNVRTSLVSVPADPFGVVYALHEDVAFVTLDDNLGVLDTTAFIPSLLHLILLPVKEFGSGAAGIALTHDGGHILVTLNTAAVIVDAAKAAAGSSDAVVGALNGTAGNSAIEITITQDNEYAFVSQEYGNNQTGYRGDIEVFQLHKPTANGSVAGIYIGELTLGVAVVGTALSPDGCYLYATSEVAAIINGTQQGALTVIDVETLKTNPNSSQAILSSAVAGCAPVRVIVSSDGKVVWVTARQSNKLLAFNASKLLSDPNDALLAAVEVGTWPVGLTFAKQESRILTADSNRQNYTNATAGLSVVDVEAALRGEQAVLGSIPTGLFPREFAISPNGSTILVTDYYSQQVQAADVATIP